MKITKFPLKIINADIRSFRNECELSGIVDITKVYETCPGECFYIYLPDTDSKYMRDGCTFTIKYSRQIAGIGVWHRESLNEARDISEMFRRTDDGTS